MKIAGRKVLDAAPTEVFAAICDPATLLSVIPGCQAVEQLAPDEYVGSLLLRLPGATGTFRTSARLVDADPPRSAGLEGRIEGPMGMISGRVDFDLRAVEDGRADFEPSVAVDAPAAGDAPLDDASADDRSAPDRSAATPIRPRTLLEYRGQAVIQGPLARLDSRFAESLAATLIGQGLHSLNSHLNRARSTVASTSGRPSTTEAPE